MKKLDGAQRITIERAISQIIEAIGGDIRSEGLKETPTRVASMFEEVFEGMRYTNEELAKMYSKQFEETKVTGLVLESNIPVFSYCEHHLALMYNMKVHIAYLPKGKVLGLSKLARIADMVCKRLQLQERIGADIAEVMQLAIGAEDIAVIIEGEHSCMSARGIKKSAVTKTATLLGEFEKNSQLRQELYALLK